jgi:phosphocarrier protein HPr
MVTVQVVVVSEVGLHARPATLLVRSATAFHSDIHIRKVDRPGVSANAKSILEVLALGVDKGDRVEFICEGDDELQAAAMLKQLIDTDFAGFPRGRATPPV